MEEKVFGPNSSSLATDSDPYNVNYWSKKWEENQIGWHENCVHPMLLKLVGEITGQKKVSSEPITDSVQFQENGKKTWFLPLCGKTMDISYLLRQGFRVIGVEAVAQAIESISTEQSIQFEYDEKRKLYSGSDGRLQIYCGDLFTCPLEQFAPVDFVWDRGSFIAVEYHFRSNYIESVQKVLKKSDGTWHDFVYFLQAMKYDKSKFEGPPRSIDDQDMEKYFASWSNVRLLESKELPEGSNILKRVGEEGGSVVTYVMTPVK